MPEARQQQGSSNGVILAVDHLAADESVVRSGIALADVVIKALENAEFVTVSFAGLKGASSSYFNVFLCRIDEGCGIAELGDHIRVKFGSKIQEMIYNRSLEALDKGPKRPPSEPEADEITDPPSRPPFWKRLLGI